MQHLPPIAEPYNPIHVPYKGGQYERGDYATYASRATPSFDLTSLQSGDCGSHGREAAAKMLQAWLFFGLLQEALQLEVNIEDFVERKTVTTADGQVKTEAFITTAELRGYLGRWREQHEAAKATPQLLARRKQQTLSALHTAYDVWSEFDDFSAITGPEIKLSIQLLGSAVDHAVTSVSSTLPGQPYTLWIPVGQAYWRRTSSPFIEQRMLNMGWCPSVVRQLQAPTKLPLQVYVSLLKPSVAQDPGVHAKCKFTDLGCLASNIDDGEYKTKHVEGCDCADKDTKAFLRVDADELRRILRSGRIPIVFLDEGEGVPKLQLTSQQHDVQYTAISHVWADGMGNREANSLPLCQIRKIVHYLYESFWPLPPKTPPSSYNDSIWRDPEPEWDEHGNEAAQPRFTLDELRSKPLYFWLDTLCIPVEERDRDLRRAAIRNMRAVYYRALRVIVLDATLLNTPGTLDTLSTAEWLGRIAASPWSRRYWTLQEALLAKKLYIRFKDTAIQKLGVRTDDAEAEQIYSRCFDNEVEYHIDQIDFGMRSKAYLWPYESRVSSVWSMLTSRIASHKIDETICVATMLDMDTKPLLEIDTGPNEEAIAETRLRKLWEMYEKFPLGVLCRPALKFADPPWAFARMEDCAAIVPPTLVPATQQDGSLHFVHHGFVITEPLHHTPTGVIAVVLDGETYFIRQNAKNGNGPWSGHEASDGIHLASRIDFQAPGTRIAVVLSQDYPEPVTACLGALISINAYDDIIDGNVLQGRYLRAVSIFKAGSPPDQRAFPPWSDAETEEKTKLHDARWTPTEQKWIVRGVS